MPTTSSRLAAILLAFLATAPAHAQAVATAYVHTNFGDVEIRRGGPGLQLGYHGRWLGFELDIDRHHHFFKDGELESIPNPCVPGVRGACIDNDTEAWILMGNVLGLMPVSKTSRWRPYAAAGAGVVHAWIHSAGEYNSDQTNLAVNLGAGVTYWIADWIGLRADVRYFHVFVDEATREGGYYHDYDFVRVALGVTFGR